MRRARRSDLPRRSSISHSTASGDAVTHGSPSVDRVAEEDLRERLADERANAAPPDRLRRVLARGSAAEVRVDEQNRRAVVARIRRTGDCRLCVGLRAIVLEEMLLEALERHRPQKPRRDDPIGVDVVAAQRQRACRESRRMRSIAASTGNAPHVDDFSGNGRGRNHRRAHQQRAAGRAALPALEVAVRRRGADLGGLRARPGSSPGTSSSRRRATRSPRR